MASRISRRSPITARARSRASLTSRLISPSTTSAVRSL